jgi:hypothetical protein
LVWRNAYIQQSVAVKGNAALCRNAWRNFLKPPEVDAIHCWNWRWLSHNFRSVVSLLGVKIEHEAFLADFFPDFIRLLSGIDSFWEAIRVKNLREEAQISLNGFYTAAAQDRVFYN